MFNTETVIHLIGDPCLKLVHKNKGCWCFEFDDHGSVGTKTVLVKRLRPTARYMVERGQDIRRRDTGAARAVTSDPQRNLGRSWA